MLSIEDVDDLSHPTRALLAAQGYVESGREAYAHWKSVNYTHGDITFSFEYSRRAGNLKRVYVESISEMWFPPVDLHVKAMYFESYVAKYLAGRTFTEKLHTLIANPVPYCMAAAAEADRGQEECARLLDFHYGDAFRQHTTDPHPPVR